MQNKIRISVIIASKDDSRKDNVLKLLGDISRQDIDAEVEVLQVEGVSPAGKARNIGAEKANGDYLVFIDNDIRIPDKEALSKLIQPLLTDVSIAATFSSLLIPTDSSAFQRQYAAEIPRSQIPLVQVSTDAGALSTHFCAIRKEAFLKVGRFNEYLRRGEDPEISNRLKKAGYRLVLTAQVICYHPVPKNLIEVIKLHFRNGVSVAFADMHYPDLNIDVNPNGIIYPARIATKRYRLMRFTFAMIGAFFKARLLLMLAKISYALGYFCAFLKE